MSINQHSPSNVIEAWQQFLNNQGCSTGTPDGIWGPHTAEGTEAFQKANKLAVDGLAGPATLAAAESKGFKAPSSNFPPPGFVNTVFDISHLNSHVDLAKAKAGGMQAVFHKATQYLTFHDNYYRPRMQEAKAAGLLWGAYHFGAGGDGATQAKYFLDHAQPDGNTLLVLDFERDTISGQTNMTITEGANFVEYIYQQTGKYPGIYGGNYLRDLTKYQGHPTLSKCWLWYARYLATATPPNGWYRFDFWQYTDGVHGPDTTPVPGVVGHCDRDAFQGTAEELAAFWREHGV